ncbi:MAG: hypothetical protein ING51_08240, partial [Rhodocyclaceae bacterium]|nr:hypothetical protein [Rhodocyclaceae bacterium]
MGELLTGVRRGKIPNPFSRKFDLERWRELRSFDDADMCVQDAGVIVFALLEALRPNLKVGAPSISRARALCAHANQHLVQLHQSFIQAVAQLPSPSIDLEQVLDTKMAITGATLGETTDALGDSYVYPLREAINGLTNFNERLSRSEIGKLLEETFHEIHVANQWYLIWFFWTDVLWTGGRLRSTPEGNLELSRDDMFSETI